MDFTELTLRLLLLFFPGVICTWIIDNLTIDRRKEPFYFLLKSFVFGLSSYFLYWIALWILHWLCPLAFGQSMLFMRALTDPKAQISYQEIFFVSLCGIALGLMSSALSNSNASMYLARYFRITEKSGYADVWGYTFNSLSPRWVTVRDHRNNLVYDGYLRSFTQDSEGRELLLLNVNVCRNDSGEFLYNVDAMYVARDRNDITLEFQSLKTDNSDKIVEENANA